MEHRLGRTLRVFLAILAAAGLYRLTVVPLVEPRSRGIGPAAEMTAEQERAIREADAARFAAGSDLFPAGSWELSPPLSFAMGKQMRLLCKDFHILPDRRVRLEQCTIIVLPDRRATAPEREPGRTFVLRAPQGAILEFDSPPDLKRLTSLPRLVGGSLRGQVTIRGTPTGADREDDIEIVTHDIELSELEVRSNDVVQFRYGRSRGAGRGLVAMLRPRQGPAAAAAPRPGAQTPSIGGIDSIRIDRDVRLRLEGLSGSMVPGAGPGAGGAADTDARPADAAPVLVTCRGALCLNEPAKVITLEEDVDVIRDLPDRSRDQIACDLLTIYLARTGSQGRLEPVQIIAKGAPVVARSSGENLEACAAELGYDLRGSRLVLRGDAPVSVKVRGDEVVARGIEYRAGEAGALGRLDAVGPGWAKLRGAADAPVGIAWEKSLLLRPDQKNPREHVASVVGDARVTLEGQGLLRGAEMHLWLAMSGTAAGPARPAAGPDLSRVRPLRLQVRGNVEAESTAAKVSARTDELRLYFVRSKDQPAAPARADGASAPAVAEPPVARPAAVVRQSEPEPDRGAMALSAALIIGEISLAPGGVRLDRVERLAMKGQVRLVEQPLPAAAVTARPAIDESIRIDGDELEVLRPQRFDTRAIVWGKPARVAGRGVELQGPLVEVDRGLNRMKVDGAGRLSGPLAAGAGGLDAFAFAGQSAGTKPAAAGADRITLTWRGRLDFDGQTAQFFEAAVAETGGTRVSADVLEAVLDRPFSFEGRTDGRPPPQLARFAGAGAVRIDHESREDDTRAIQRLHLRDFVLERASGEFVGHGPGRLTIVRNGASPSLTPPAGPVSPVRPVAAVNPAAGLTYLGVDFQREVRGSINRRVLEFHQRVEAIHGPVAGWNDALDPRAPRGPGKDEVLIKASQLNVAQGPPPAGQPRGGIEVQAGGNVEVEAESFSGVSSRLTWSEPKDLLVFEGNGLADARIFMRDNAGGAERSLAAEKILYWRGLNRVEFSGVRHADLDGLGGPGLPNLSGARPKPVAPAPVPPPGT